MTTSSTTDGELAADPSAAVQPLLTADYTQATEPCDLVMKGGVTSGVVYPTTMCRLAQKFRFKSIGGTSAGALAAALAAAAEHQRSGKPSSEGFRRLAEVSGYLGTGANLRNLFQPSRSTAPLFNIAMTWIGTSSRLALLGALATAYFWCLTVAIIVAVLMGIGFSHIDPNRIAVTIIAVIVFLIVVIGLIVWRLLAAVRTSIPDNDFGLCTGLKKPNPNAPRPLTPWLADRIDYIAGLTANDTLADDSPQRPLTFGDLYGEPDPTRYPYPGGSPVLDALNATSERRVNLQMVTTDVTAGRPYRLPFDDDDTIKFFYDPLDMKRFFPERVLRQMRGTSHETRITIANPGTDRARKSINLIPFPAAADLPVVVAARMSMSFPILFSAVPLFAVRREAFEGWSGDPDSQPEFRKTWFSDGGLSSNIPIHFFDGPIPRWPTFALNLRGFPRTRNGMPLDRPLSPDSPDASKVFLATKFDPDVELFDLEGTGRIFQFANSLIDAMRNWNDNTLMQLDGYRERTAEIAMSDTEGGLNLTMPPATLHSIMARGIYAAERFDRQFATPTLGESAGWNDHRLIRLRASLLMQSEWTRRYSAAWKRKVAADTPVFDELIDASGETFSKPYAPEERESAHRFAAVLAGAPDHIDAGVTLTKRLWPVTELRARPRV